MEQNKKRSKNDERKQHVDKKTGLPRRKLVENVKEHDAEQELKNYVHRREEHPE